MIKRIFIVGLIYTPIGLFISWNALWAENQKPWLVALGIVVMITAIFGNCFAVSKKKKN